jgi:chaperone BCS1
LQAVFKLANETWSAAGADDISNTTDTLNGTSTMTDNFDINTLKSLFPLLYAIPALGNWANIFLLGGLLESARRLVGIAWQYILNSFWLTVRFEGNDEAFSWMMVWLSKQPTWRRARDLQVSTSSFGLNARAIRIPGETLDTTGKNSGDARTIGYLPAFGTTHSLFYKGHWMRITRNERVLNDSYNYVQESLTLTIFAWSHDILNNLLLEAKNFYEEEDQHRVAIYIADTYNCWNRSGSRPKRDLDSIILEDGIKEMLLEDARDFMASEEWYNERGIPFRRGYLLHGVPGSGKTSIIHGLAGALNLDIYVISLAKKGLDDTTLNTLICDLPSRCIALMEDIDAAFTHSVSRDAEKKGEDSDNSGGGGGHTGVTLSGLLGAIDGVAAQEGRLLFATTNKYHVLDPALCRPGRMDIHVEFTLATQNQAEKLFERFYPAIEDEASSESGSSAGADTDSAVTLVNEKAPQPNGHAHPNGHAKPAATSVTPPTSKKTATRLTRIMRSTYAKQFASQIPQKELSMSAIQGHLLNYKTRPIEAVKSVEEFVEMERERAKKRKLSENVSSKDASAKDVKDVKDVKDGEGESETQAKEQTAKDGPKEEDSEA